MARIGKVPSLKSLKRKYAKQINNPHLARLGTWREASSGEREEGSPLQSYVIVSLGVREGDVSVHPIGVTRTYKLAESICARESATDPDRAYRILTAPNLTDGGD